MIREQERIRKDNVYQAVKAKKVNKPYFTKTTDIFKEVASVFGYNARSVSNIYYEMRKKEEKELHKIRLSKKQSAEIVQWFIEKVTTFHELKLQTQSASHLTKDFTINPLPVPVEYSFDFWFEAHYRVVRTGDGKTEPIDHEVIINHYTVELTAVYNDEGEELILRQKDIQEIEDHLYANLKLHIDYYE